MISARSLANTALTAPAPRPDAAPLYALQYLRAIAALTIVVYHICRFRDFGIAMQGTWLKRMTDASAPAAVDLFFALSGFLMVYTQSGKPRPAADFFRRRACRIIPLYWLVTGAWFAMMALTATAANPNPETPLHLVTSLLFCAQAFGFANPLILPGWSLEFEMVFYALIALAIWRRGAGFAGATCAAVVALVAVRVLPPICLEFALGMVAGMVFPRRLPPAVALPALAVALGVFVYGSTALRGQVDGGWYRLAFWGLPMLVLLLNGLNLRQVRIAPLLILADCSYAIYVSHHLVLYVFAKLISTRLLPVGWGGAGVAACVVACTAAGIALHYAVERPMDDLLRGRRRLWRRPATAPQRTPRLAAAA